MSYHINKTKNWILSIVMIASVGGAMFTTALPQTVVAVAATPTTPTCDAGVLGFPAWYRGLTDGSSTCNLLSPSDTKFTSDGLVVYVLIIGSNIVEIILVAVVYAAAFYLLYGGFLFIVSQGRPESAANARKTMLNAVVGLLISIVAVAVVKFVYNGLINGLK